MLLISSTKSLEIQRKLAERLIPNGINVVQMDNLEDIYAAMGGEAKICLLDDSEYDLRKVLEFMIRLKKDPDKKGCRVIILTFIKYLQAINALIKLGFDGVLTIHYSPEKIADRVLNFIQTLFFPNDTRTFMRIKPGLDEYTFLKCYATEFDKYLEGRITDISLTGVAGTFYPLDFKKLKEGKFYKHSCIILDKLRIYADLKVVKCVNNKAVFVYERMTEDYKMMLAEYVYFKIRPLFIPPKRKKSV
jgi:hypothetical protein